jgi:hypothetical protein
MGNPSVRFDEGWERGGHWPSGLSTYQPQLNCWQKLERGNRIRDNEGQDWFINGSPGR